VSVIVFEDLAHWCIYLVPTLGVIVIIAILHDAFEVMLLPRRVKSKMRIVRYFFDGTWAVWRVVGLRFRSEDRRHNFLGLYGPLSLILLLIVWAVGLIGAFGSLFWSLNSVQFSFHQLAIQLYFSGVTFFTLGYGDMVPHGALAKLISVAEAGTGLGFIAMVIGYLPVMYQLFSRREAQVITLDAVAGSPPNAITLVRRHAEGQGLGTLDRFFLDWQQWSAQLLESQLSYPMLAYYRSQHDNQSWLAALAAVMDASVLVMVGLDGVQTFQARLTFATARLAVIEMGRVLGIGPRTPEQDRLPSGTFLALQTELGKSDVHFVDEEAAEERLTAFRNTYEPFLVGLAQHLLLVLPAWAPDPNQIDNWVNSPRGKSAKRLLESAESEPKGSSAPERTKQSGEQ
jgi:hypothetical protein